MIVTAEPKIVDFVTVYVFQLLGEDLRLMVVFQMLVMATQVKTDIIFFASLERRYRMVNHGLILQPPCGKPMNKKVKDIQGDLAQLLYRLNLTCYPYLTLSSRLNRFA